jgi:regulatory protein
MNPTCRPRRLPSRQRKIPPQEEEFESLPADVEYDRALDKALKLLTVRSRSRSELGDRLGRAGFSGEVIEKVDARLNELGLVDDLAFAKEWASQAIAGRGLSSQRIQRELATRGVPEAVTEEALPYGPGGDFDRALGLARRRVLTYGGLPKPTAYRRLAGFLGQRGYEEDLIEEVCSRVLGDPEATETVGN